MTFEQLDQLPLEKVQAWWLIFLIVQYFSCSSQHSLDFANEIVMYITYVHMHGLRHLFMFVYYYFYLSISQALIKQNNLSDKVILIPGKVEEVCNKLVLVVSKTINIHAVAWCRKKSKKETLGKLKHIVWSSNHSIEMSSHFITLPWQQIFVSQPTMVLQTWQEK